MEKNWKYITQDEDGSLTFRDELVKAKFNSWWSTMEDMENNNSCHCNYNPNWENAWVNLESHDWKLNEDGHLIAVEKQETGNRHVHADFMIAFANDTTLKFQWRDREGEWLECTYPSFSNHIEYRIKPEKKKYRVAKLMTGVTLVADNFAEAAGIAQDSRFVEWLTDWIEYE